MKKLSWTAEKIKEGFERFIKEQGRLPKSVEIDGLDYLPSRKLIERNFGGVEKLRKELGYSDTHFGKGKFRSAIAHKANTSGRTIELVVEKLLKDKFGEVFVHTEKIFDGTKNRVDFYIYSPSGNFGIDVFGTDTLHNLQSNMNVKLNKYSGFKERLFFVVVSDALIQTDLDSYVTKKTKILPNNAKMITLDSLELMLQGMQTYPDPLIALRVS
ncbi:MAG: hypothetical protein M3M85_03525 [bacterium]|nr:hypothetical protein [bacterium]